ncbi:primosomal protein N' [Thiobacillus denitrificans]|uniref:Replication restart protein PriA n=1 Tax=Thiobacillus denitrificans TaxID=36861 RepID=A0A106BN25_THIDE|nr:primosomal protein N' [Thiobacillus denitrificans]KVW95482.1 primosomal protein DnaI [Thiobacillus denitrificans]
MPSILQVALDTPLHRLFDYRLPDSAGTVQPGSLVEVPFGRTRQVGIALGPVADSTVGADKLREVIRVLDDRPALSPDILRLAQFCADYYHYPLGAILLATLPPRLKNATPFVADTPWLVLTEAGQVAEPAARARAQRALLDALRAAPQPRETLRAQKQGRHAAALVAAGWAAWTSVPPPSAVAPRTAESPPATAGQQAALDALLPALGKFGVHLVHGVTGSGKTELYLRLIDAVLARGLQALVLIPEIALTPQLEQHFRRRFPGRRFATLHSGLAESARTENWLAAPDCDVLLGTRLSVFAPLSRLGLIVVDEEHDASFKQQDSLRYSARDVAIARGKQRGVPVVLGSATPSLESYAQAINGRYQLIELKQRAISQARLPAIELVDLKHIPVDNGLTRPALQVLTDTLARGEQSLVFLNRRGYAPALYCPSCGWVSPCPHCSGRLVLHRTSHRLKCHHCGLETRIPSECPGCGNPDLKPLGQGTQRLEETLTALLPAARIRRIDRDTMRPRAWAELGAAVHGGEIDLLVGTQMLAKGHDFPNMTLALILDTDGALYSPDFRATERLFAQLMQVAGRAGRADKPGRVLIQTAFPDHPLFRYLQRHDYSGYARALLAERKQLDLPPFTRQVLLRAEAPTMAAALAFLQRAAALAPATADVSVFAATPAPMARVANLERAQLLIQSAQRQALQAFVRDWRPQLDGIRPRVARWSLDVDPLVF